MHNLKISFRINLTLFKWLISHRSRGYTFLSALQACTLIASCLLLIAWCLLLTKTWSSAWCPRTWTGRRSFSWRSYCSLSWPLGSPRAASCRPSCCFGGTRRCRTPGGSCRCGSFSLLARTCPRMAWTAPCSRTGEGCCSPRENDSTIMSSSKIYQVWIDHRLVGIAYSVRKPSARSWCCQLVKRSALCLLESRPWHPNTCYKRPCSR